MRASCVLRMSLSLKTNTRRPTYLNLDLALQLLPACCAVRCPVWRGGSVCGWLRLRVSCALTNKMRAGGGRDAGTLPPFAWWPAHF